MALAAEPNPTDKIAIISGVEFQGVNKHMALGEVSTAYFKNPITGGMMEFTNEVIVYEEGRAFGWSGDAMLGRQDHHIFRIEKLSDG